MSHTLVSAMPGEPGGYKSGNVGEYTCSCGSVLPGIGTYKKHRIDALHAEAIERAAQAIAADVLPDMGWGDFGPKLRGRYLYLAEIALDAAKVRR